LFDTFIFTSCFGWVVVQAVNKKVTAHKIVKCFILPPFFIKFEADEVTIHPNIKPIKVNPCQRMVNVELSNYFVKICLN
jgi:hypothetical protein